MTMVETVYLGSQHASDKRHILQIRRLLHADPVSENEYITYGLFFRSSSLLGLLQHPLAFTVAYSKNRSHGFRYGERGGHNLLLIFCHQQHSVNST